MKKYLIFSSILVAYLAIFFPTIALSEPQTERQLDRLVKTWAAKSEVPSVLLRMEKSGALLYSGSAGETAFKSGHTVTPESYFRSASVGKLFTAVAVMRLTEKGVLKLEDSIGKYLPKELINRLFNWKGEGYGAEVTIRHLLSHTSGLANLDNDPAKNAWIAQFPEKKKKPEELLEFAALQGPQFAPGKGQAYTSAGYMLLGRIIESATGDAYHTVIRREALAPLGLTHTFEHTFELPDSIDPIHSYSGPYDLNQIHPSMEYADGGFVTTTADLTRFGLALAKGRPFANPDTLMQMLKSYGEEGIGLGPFVGKTEEGEVYFYHPGHWGVLLYVLPAKELAVAYTVNQSEINYSKFLDQILKIVW